MSQHEISINYSSSLTSFLISIKKSIAAAFIVDIERDYIMPISFIGIKFVSLYYYAQKRVQLSLNGKRRHSSFSFELGRICGHLKPAARVCPAERKNIFTNEPVGRAHSSIIDQTSEMLSDSSSSSRSTMTAESERKSGNSPVWLAQPAVALFGLSFLYASLSHMMTRELYNH